MAFFHACLAISDVLVPNLPYHVRKAPFDVVFDRLGFRCVCIRGVDADRVSSRSLGGTAFSAPDLAVDEKYDEGPEGLVSMRRRANL